MNKQKRIILAVILVAVVLMGIGYAALTSVTLNVTGKATASASQDNFQVYFTGANTTTSTADNVTATVAAKEKTANVEITGLSKKGDKEYAILEIENADTSVDADSVEVTASGTDNNVIAITVEMCTADGTVVTGTNAVAAGTKTYVKVTAEVIKTPSENSEATITATITAKPATV